MRVVLLWHIHKFNDGSESIKLIGVYSSKSQAEAALERVRTQPGFRDHPAGFEIDSYAVDEDHWTEGFTADPTDQAE
jgi:hypothetical protein